VARGRLHPVELLRGSPLAGVYAVGRPDLTRHGRWIAAVLCCGSEALLSHESAAALWGIRDLAVKRERRHGIDVSLPAQVRRRREGIRVHRSSLLRSGDRAEREAIAVTSPARTLIDLGSVLTPGQLEAAVNEADKHDLIDPESLRLVVTGAPRLPGIKSLRDLLDRRTFRLTDSELERRFLRLVRRAGLRVPQTGVRVRGHKVDFFWPDLGLVAETDGLRYHRTATQQARDRRRDQDHTAAGLTTLRFTHAQIAFEADRVTAILIKVARRARSF
jgi:very-short-patch-repair endonuclease